MLGKILPLGAVFSADVVLMMLAVGLVFLGTIAIGATRVWVADRLDDKVKSIDPATNSIDDVVSVQVDWDVNAVVVKTRSGLADLEKLEIARVDVAVVEKDAEGAQLDHRADHGIGAHAAHAALGELDGPREVFVIGFGALHWTIESSQPHLPPLPAS